MRTTIDAIATIPSRPEMLASVRTGRESALLCLRTPALEPLWRVQLQEAATKIMVSPDGATAVTTVTVGRAIQVINLLNRTSSVVSLNATIFGVEMIDARHVCLITGSNTVDLDVTSGLRDNSPTVDYPPECIWLKNAVTYTDRNQRLSIFQDHVVFSELSTGRIIEVRQLGERKKVGLAPFGVPHPVNPLKIARPVDPEDSEALSTIILPTFTASDQVVVIDDKVLLFSGQQIAQIDANTRQVDYYLCGALPSLGDPRAISFHANRGLVFIVEDFEVRGFGPWESGQPQMSQENANAVKAFRFLPPSFVRPGDVACDTVSDSLIVTNYVLPGAETHLALQSVQEERSSTFYPDGAL